MKIGSIIPFISFPIGTISLSLLVVEYYIKSPVLIENPISQLVLIAGSMTTISLLLLSFRAITQVLIQRKSNNNKN